MVNHAEARADASRLSDVPVESSVWIQGQVLLRPPSARRPVSLLIVKVVSSIG